MKFYLPPELIKIMNELKDESLQSDIEKANLIYNNKEGNPTPDSNKAKGLPGTEFLLGAVSDAARDEKPLKWFYTAEAKAEYEKGDDISRYWLFCDFLFSYSKAQKGMYSNRESSLMRLAAAFVWIAKRDDIYGGYEGVIDPEVNPLVKASLELDDKERLEEFEIVIPPMSDKLRAWLDISSATERYEIYKEDTDLQLELAARERARGDRDVFDLLYAFTKKDFWQGYDMRSFEYPYIELTPFHEKEQNAIIEHVLLWLFIQPYDAKAMFKLPEILIDKDDILDDEEYLARNEEYVKYTSKKREELLKKKTPLDMTDKLLAHLAHKPEYTPHQAITDLTIKEKRFPMLSRTAKDIRSSAVKMLIYPVWAIIGILLLMLSSDSLLLGAIAALMVVSAVVGAVFIFIPSRSALNEYILWRSSAEAWNMVSEADRPNREKYEKELEKYNEDFEAILTNIFNNLPDEALDHGLAWMKAMTESMHKQDELLKK